ncbi:DNA-processing protein DprA [Francisellaceae bacterium]|nr:DNA-processing protein DprA [Francisellaceae bacterium]
MNVSHIQALIALLKTPKLRKQKILSLLDNNIDLIEFIKDPNMFSEISQISLEHKDHIKTIRNDINKIAKPELEWINTSPLNHLITYSDSRYPERLKNISNPPLLLYIIGEPNTLSLKQISIVGSRTPSQYGKQNAKEFAKALSNKGYCITSGIAYGIDSIAHEAAIQAEGQTIAVMGTGINLIYPSQNKSLAEKIIHNGAIITEFPLNTPPTRFNFPKRNRIISGLSVGTLIVESSIKSGTLITAKHAIDQSREVFAIPGNIHHPESAGCHWLIQEGAKLVTCPEDITIELPQQFNDIEGSPTINTTHINDNSQSLSEIQSNILSLINYEITALDSIIEVSGLPADEASMILFELEMNSLIESIPGGYRKL